MMMITLTGKLLWNSIYLNPTPPCIPRTQKIARLKKQFEKKPFFNFDKCIFQFWQKHISILINTNFNFDKYIFQFWQINCLIGKIRREWSPLSGHLHPTVPCIPRAQKIAQLKKQFNTTRRQNMIKVGKHTQKHPRTIMPLKKFLLLLIFSKFPNKGEGLDVKIARRCPVLI